MHYVQGYLIRCCPRYLPQQAGQLIPENLLMQRALWNAARTWQVEERGAAVELRFVVGEQGHRLTAAVLVADSGPQPPQMFCDVLEQLLPEGYDWSILPILPQAVDGIGLTQRAGPWRVARLVRRVAFVDLPAGPAWFPSPTGSSGPSAALRRLPLLTDLPQEDHSRSGPQCLPLPGELVDASPNRRQWCQDMQHAAPVIVSIALHPPDPQAQDEDRIIATLLRRLISPYAAGLAGAGLARDENLGSAFDRYWLPLTYQCNLTVRVAARDDARAVGIAHSLATRLGGSRAFQVLAPNRDLASLQVLGQAEAELPSRHSLVRERDYWMEVLDRITAPARLDTRSMDPRYLGFLLRMRHLYTLDEAEQMLRLPYAQDEGLPGMATRVVPPFYPPLLDAPPGDEPMTPGRIRLGRIHGSGPRAQRSTGPTEGAGLDYRHTLSLEQLTKHALIVGKTGAGKTTATRNLLVQLAHQQVPFLVIEPIKAEYFRALRTEVAELRRYRLETGGRGRKAGDTSAPPPLLHFEPLRLQRGISVSRHVGYLKSCFQAAFPLNEVMALILENGLLAYYTSPREAGGCGLDLFRTGGRSAHGFDAASGRVYPSFHDFCRFFLDRYLPIELQPPEKASANAPGSLFVQECRQIFRRRFRNLREGVLGQVFRAADRLVTEGGDTGFYNPFDTYVTRPTVIELEGLADPEDKALMMAFLLTFLYELRQGQAEENRPQMPLRHLLVVEEAHRLLSRDGAQQHRSSDTVGAGARAGAIALFTDMLAEMRAYRQGLLIVEQIPTKLVSEVIKNTNLQLMLRMTSHEDRQYLGETMNLTEAQRQFIAYLRPGQGVVFEENLDDPLLLDIPG